MITVQNEKIIGNFNAYKRKKYYTVNITVIFSFLKRESERIGNIHTLHTVNVILLSFRTLQLLWPFNVPGHF
jgi:hypothetical protein